MNDRKKLDVRIRQTKELVSTARQLIKDSEKLIKSSKNAIAVRTKKRRFFCVFDAGNYLAGEGGETGMAG